MQARDIMTTDLVTVSRALTIRRLIKILQQNHIAGVPVVDAEGRLEGIVSGTDIIRAVGELIKVTLSLEAMQENIGKLNWVEGIMTRDVVSVTEETDIRDVFKIMAQKSIHRVPVLKGGKLVGIISASDAHRAFESLLKD